MRERTRLEIFKEIVSAGGGGGVIWVVVVRVSTRSNFLTRLRMFGFFDMRLSRADMEQKCREKMTESIVLVLLGNSGLVSSVLFGSYGVTPNVGVYLVMWCGVGIYIYPHAPDTNAGRQLY
jgi:hypothetical protein